MVTCGLKRGKGIKTISIIYSDYVKGVSKGGGLENRVGFWGREGVERARIVWKKVVKAQRRELCGYTEDDRKFGMIPGPILSLGSFGTFIPLQAAHITLSGGNIPP